MTHASAPTPAISLTPSESTPLQEAMRELQLSVSAYYSETAYGGDLGPRVRAFLNATQTVNDLLTNQIGDAASYKALFTTDRHRLAGLIEAVKFARNVVQHVLHIVRPSDQFVLVGGELGFRMYAEWDEIPANVVSALHRGTRALEPAYRTELQGREIGDRMLDVLKFFADVAPQLVHRDSRGEWTGFPLMSQPGMNSRIHPEEPEDQAAARSWMDGRRPGGDCRVICGQVTIDGVPYVYGHTFVGRLSFAPFVETVDQANFDINLGYEYMRGDIAANIDDVTAQHPKALQGAVLRSRGDVSEWAEQLATIDPHDDWSARGVDAESWKRIVELEISTVIPGFSFNPRRARRLNAIVPPS